MKQKRQQIDHWVAFRGPFLRFLFHFRDKSFFMTTGATLVRYEQPLEGSASPPPYGLSSAASLCGELHMRLDDSTMFTSVLHEHGLSLDWRGFIAIKF